jgi:hypothetical protein
MYTPAFPFKENQIILSSDRVLLHSKTDGVFLFGNAAVGLSSTKTINLDAYEKVLIDSPKIELGREAETLGEPVVLGKALTLQLLLLLQNLSNASVLLGQVSESDLGASMQYIASAGQTINKEANRLITVLNQSQNPILSKTTFTR